MTILQPTVFTDLVMANIEWLMLLPLAIMGIRLSLAVLALWDTRD